MTFGRDESRYRMQLCMVFYLHKVVNVQIAWGTWSGALDSVSFIGIETSRIFTTNTSMASRIKNWSGVFDIQYKAFHIHELKNM